MLLITLKTSTELPITQKLLTSKIHLQYRFKTVVRHAVSSWERGFVVQAFEAAMNQLP